jgi:L-threonylcarbamoyladenylate synthase
MLDARSMLGMTSVPGATISKLEHLPQATQLVNTRLTDSPDDAADAIRGGQVVAFPTETVYGLGADAFDADAVQQIFAAKGRPSDNPLIVHIADRAQVDRLAASVPDAAHALMDRFFPGPLTLILPRHPDVPHVVTAGLDTVGVRMPDHPVARRFLAACGTPVAAPSANRSGRPSPTTWQAVRDDLDGRIPCILKGGRTRAGLESTVVDGTSVPPVVLRPGAIAVDALRAVVPDVQEPDPNDDGATRSPGTKHRHYAPSAQVRPVDDPADAVPDAAHAYIGLDAPPQREAFGLMCVCPSVEAYAHDLFHVFRASEAAGCTTIYCQTVPDTGLGEALMDRLRRAASATA